MSILPSTGAEDEEEAAEQAIIFIQEYLKTGNAMVACSRAGIRDPRYTMEVVAERYLNRDDIQVALKAFDKLQVAAQPIEVGRESIVADMQVVFEKALSDRQYGSAISAKKLQALISGLISAKIDITHRHSVESMTDEQLMRIAAASDKKIIDITPDGDEDGD